MVNQENMQRWVDALRGGEYTQIRGALENLAGNCAEGVACREAIKAGVYVRALTDRKASTTLFNGCELSAVLFDGCELNMPASVREWLGLAEPAVKNPATGVLESVIVANDEWKWSFAEIADALYERYLKEPGSG